MEKYLLIKDQDACEFLELPTDPEYFYDENDIKTLLNEGTLDQLLDCLEFAPGGVIALIKKIAVETKLDSSEKREAISKHLNINIDSMIKNNELSKGPLDDSNENGSRVRRSTPINSGSNAQDLSKKYNVISRDK
jgi:hypothetical protein